MKITATNKINYHLEAMGIITSYVKDAPFYEKIKESQKLKYNIPMEKLDSLFEEICQIYDYVIENISVPKEKMEFYFAPLDDEVPNIGHLLMSFVMYDDSKEAIDRFMQLPTNEKLRQYMNTLYKNSDNWLNNFDFHNITDKYYVNFINNSSIGKGAKLQYILMYYNIEEYLNEVYEIVESVISVLKNKEKELQAIADNFQYVMTEEIKLYGDRLLENYDIKISVDNDMVLRPLIIRANSLIIKPWQIELNIDEMESKNAYIGIHIKVLFDLINTYFIDDNRIISILKALGDKSKFDILKSIKDNQMYGVEIARKLNLTTATVSHHMSNLYNLSLVNYVTDNNKMNYMLNKETVVELIAALENIFLGE